jgi:hypothetical protein
VGNGAASDLLNLGLHPSPDVAAPGCSSAADLDACRGRWGVANRFAKRPKNRRAGDRGRDLSNGSAVAAGTFAVSAGRKVLIHVDIRISPSRDSMTDMKLWTC